MKNQAIDYNLPVVSPDRPRILVVDDQLSLLRSVQALLRINGYQVVLASSGREALVHLDKSVFDLVLLDLQMPDIHGLEVLEYIRKNEIETEIVIISGESNFGEVRKILRLGAYDFIRKPYVPDELLKTVGMGIQRNSERKRQLKAEKFLTESERMHRFIVNNSPDFIYILNPDGQFVYVNDKVEHLLGYKRRELIGKHFSCIIHPNNADEIHNFFSEHRTGQRATRKVEVRLRVNPANPQVGCLDNLELIVELSALGIYKKNKKGEKYYSGTLGCARDISERKKSEASVSFQAYHDILTRLPNRILFEDRINQAFAHARRSNVHFAVMFLDLDRFKLINDTFGHVLGDLILQQVSARILSCLRAEDTLSRFGGDEFCLLLPGMKDRDGVAAVAEKILQQMREPFFVDNHELFLSMSLGIATYPEGGLSKDALLQSADIAMYHVKNNGKDGYCFYNDSMSNRSGLISAERDMLTALEMNQFQVYFQPKVDASRHRIVGMEALLRWQHPERGLLYPEEFLPAAEDSKLIITIGHWVLNSVCEEINRWQRSGLPRIKVSLNISPVQLEQDDFVKVFVETIQRFKVPPEIFELEITEQGVLRDHQQASEKLQALQDLGVSITLDDFGRGHASFNYLQSFPVNTLKIDRSFVREIDSLRKRPFVADGIAMLAKGMNLNLVAEGVESQLQLDYLRNLGCREVQGHLYAAAVNANTALDLMQSGSPEGPHFTFH